MSVPSLRNCIGNSVSRTAGVRYASTASVTARQPPNRPEHGEQIYVYNHLQTNQVVYSLSRGMNVCLPSYPSNFLLYATAIPLPSLYETLTNPSLRTMPPSPNSPTTAKRHAPPPSAKTSGAPWP